jgi:N-dimethylarginine dimethylaminohydrolase
MTQINSYTNWGRLQEVWLGDCYPAHFYDHLEPEVRDCFRRITEITQEDLSIIQRKLEEFGVVVRRPQYTRLEDYIHPGNHIFAGQLIKPQICPRDFYLVYGNMFYGERYHIAPWQHVLDEYAQNPNNRLVFQNHKQHIGNVIGANAVRAGRDIYLDIVKSQSSPQAQHEYDTTVAPYFENARVHLLGNGGHVDSCFAAVKPGLLITSKYFDDYDKTFPGWQRINISEPEFHRHGHISQRSGPGNNGKFFMAGVTDKKSFNDHVIQHALDWVGDYTETFFEVNCLVLDEKNIMMMGHNPGVFEELQRNGITVHSMPFRTRTFWDGGLHCITLDIRRDDSPVDLFPERTQNLYTY